MWGEDGLANCGHGDVEIKFDIPSCFIVPFTGEQVRGYSNLPLKSHQNDLHSRSEWRQIRSWSRALAKWDEELVQEFNPPSVSVVQLKVWFFVWLLSYKVGMRVIKYAPSISYTNACVATHTQISEARREKALPLTQQAGIVSVHRSSCQSEGGEKKFRWGRAHRCRDLSVGEEWKEEERQVDAEQAREGGSTPAAPLQTLVCYSPVRMGKWEPAHVYDSITAYVL